jgi:polyferredoxin
MKRRPTPEKIPLWVLPCAIGFFILSLVAGSLIATALALEPIPFLLRFSPMFTWAATFVLALYIGRKLPAERPSEAEHRPPAFLWWEGPP